MFFLQSVPCIIGYHICPPYSVINDHFKIKLEICCLYCCTWDWKYLTGAALLSLGHESLMHHGIWSVVIELAGYRCLQMVYHYRQNRIWYSWCTMVSTSQQVFVLNLIHNNCNCDEAVYNKSSWAKICLISAHNTDEDKDLNEIIFVYMSWHRLST